MNNFIKNSKIIKPIIKYFDLEKPYALEFLEWNEWHKNTKSNKPIRYFIVETMPNKFRTKWYSITRPFLDKFWYFKNKFIYKDHLINTKLPVGNYEADERILAGLFSILTDFIEIDCAMNYERDINFSKNSKKRFKKLRSFFSQFKNNRKADKINGIKYYKEEILDYSSNNLEYNNLLEIWILYHWWNEIRPQRIDPHDLSGWSAHCSNKDSNFRINSISAEDKQKTKELLDLLHYIERKYYEEDTAMLVRLVKVRQNIWL